MRGGDVVAIVQARLGSSRLRGKVLEPIAGHSMLARVVERLRYADAIDRVVIATTTAASDDAVAREAETLGCGVFRGSEDDVLARYAGAARAFDAGVIVRVTSDCPLLDAAVVDEVCGLLAIGGCDYASNTHTRSFPRGLDVEAFHRDVLERMDRMATSQPAREHVTAHVLEYPARFVTRQLVALQDDSDLRWTVDTAEDLAHVRALVEKCGAGVHVPYRTLVERVRARPDLLAMNANIAQKPTFARAPTPV